MTRTQLLGVAAIVWGVAGILLLLRAGELLRGTVSYLIAGVALGGAFYFLLFRRIAGRHLLRIRSLSHPSPCVFSFLDWRGYGVMFFMISLGLILRFTGALPHSILGTLYMMMGCALSLAAGRFVLAACGK